MLKPRAQYRPEWPQPAGVWRVYSPKPYILGRRHVEGYGPSLEIAYAEWIDSVCWAVKEMVNYPCGR